MTIEVQNRIGRAALLLGLVYGEVSGVGLLIWQNKLINKDQDVLTIAKAVEQRDRDKGDFVKVVQVDQPAVKAADGQLTNDFGLSEAPLIPILFGIACAVALWPDRLRTLLNTREANNFERPTFE